MKLWFGAEVQIGCDVDRLRLLACALAVTLAACGGGSEPGAPPPAPVPVLKAADDSAVAAWTVGQPTPTVSIDVLANDTVPATATATTTVTVTSAPAHGKAVVSGGKVQYTPEDGFFGDDSFGYRIDAGTQSSSAVAKLSIEARLTLTGVVAPQLNSGYTVSAQAGTRAAVSVQPAAERYTVTVTSTNPADMLTLTATGTGDQAHAVLKSLVGDMGSLVKSHATPFDEAARPALRLDVLSTARYALLKHRDALPATSTALALAQQRLSSFDVLEVAGALRHFIADKSLLPSGFESTLALAQDPQGLPNAVLAAKRRDQNASPAVVRDWSGVPSLADLPAPSKAPLGVGRWALIEPAEGRPSSQFSSGWQRTLSQVLDLRADGSALRDGGDAVARSWKQEGQRLQITINRGVDQISWSPVNGGPSGSREYLVRMEIEELPKPGDGGRPVYRVTAWLSGTGCSQMGTYCTDSPEYARVALVDIVNVDQGNLAFSASEFAKVKVWGGLNAGQPGTTGEIDGHGVWSVRTEYASYRVKRLMLASDWLEHWYAESADLAGKPTGVFVFTVSVAPTEAFAAPPSGERIWLAGPTTDSSYPTRAMGGSDWTTGSSTLVVPTGWQWSADGTRLIVRYPSGFADDATEGVLIARSGNNYLIHFTGPKLSKVRRMRDGGAPG